MRDPLAAGRPRGNPRLRCRKINMVCKKGLSRNSGHARCVHSRPGPGDRRKSVESVLFPPSADSAVGLRRGRRRRCPSSEGDTLAMQAERPEGPMAAKFPQSYLRAAPGTGADRPRTTPDPRPDASAGWTSMSWCRRAATPDGPCLGAQRLARGARVDRRMSGAAPACVDGKRAAGGGRQRGARPWLAGHGHRGVSLDDRSGVFRVLCAQATPLPGAAVADCEPVAAHALELRIDGGGDRHAPCTRLLVCGVTRGDALRRAYRALSEMPGPVAVDRGS